MTAKSPGVTKVLLMAFWRPRLAGTCCNSLRGQAWHLFCTTVLIPPEPGQRRLLHNLRGFSRTQEAVEKFLRHSIYPRFPALLQSKWSVFRASANAAAYTSEAVVLQVLFLNQCTCDGAHQTTTFQFGEQTQSHTWYCPRTILRTYRADGLRCRFCGESSRQSPEWQYTTLTYNRLVLPSRQYPSRAQCSSCKQVPRRG